MATRKIGKLKFNISRDGLAFKWGDSQVRRIYFPQFGRAEEDEYDERGPVGGYDDAPDDDRYDGRYPDDGYGAGGYDDEGAYDDYDEPSRFMQFVEDSDWLNILLLVLLPPVGIYLLWWRNRYSQPVRIGISAASAVWFIIVLALLIPALFRGSSDRTTPPAMTLATVSPTPVVTATPVPSVSPTPSATATPPAATKVPDLISNFMGDLDPNASPAATPLTGGFGSSTTPGEYVYSPTSGLYYHATENCTSIPAGTTTTRMALSAAQNRNQSACPVCYGGTLYYCTENGTHYHTDKTCGDMVNPSTYTKESAESMGKTACPVCVLHTQESLDDDKTGTYSGILKNVSTDKSGIKVWYTKDGTNYHTKKSCRGMSGASQQTLLKAIQAGKTPCSTCCSGAGTLVWCTRNGQSYHATKSCRGMTGASQVTYAEALVLGKTRCTTCLKDGATGTTGGEGANVSSGNSDTSGVTVYATPNGTYYHTKRTCTGMTNAQKVSLQSMIEAGRPACPTCCASADDTVYCSTGGTYYHSFATCTGMKNAQKTTLAKALAGGYKKCSSCWNSGSAAEDADESESSSSSSGSSSGVHVYANANGKYYHTNSTCGGMRNAERVSLSSMLAEGRPACPTCCATASRTVYAKKGTKYYHYTKSCAGSGATSGTLAEALAYGLKACPDCTKSSSSSNDEKENTSSGNGGYTYTSGKSGVKVYATANGKNFHTRSTCTGMTGATYMTLEAALNAGKTPCSTCASSAKKTVYATTSSKYYHYDRTCAGSGAKSGTLADALAYGLKACPSCTKSSSNNTAEPEKETPAKPSSNTYKSGTSGKKVYATVNGTHYHSKSNCTGMKGASYITLETALNYGKTACPYCLSSAGRTVYAKSGSRYYHASKICAGSGAKSGTLGEALAYGLKACPDCVSGSGSSSGNSSSGSNDSYFSDNNNSGSGSSSGSTTPPASADTTVYIDLDSVMSRYHSKKNCGGMSGTSVTLEYAVDQGMKPCSSCNPPSGISG